MGGVIFGTNDAYTLLREIAESLTGNPLPPGIIFGENDPYTLLKLIHEAITTGGSFGLPDMTGHGGEVLGTDGTVAEWVPAGGVAVIAISATSLAALKALATTTRTAGDIVFTLFAGEAMGAMALTAGANNNDAIGEHRPDDYDLATNNVYWKRIL